MIPTITFRTLMHAHGHSSQCLQCLQEGKENNQEAQKSLSPPSISQCKVTVQLFSFMSNSPMLLLRSQHILTMMSLLGKCAALLCRDMTLRRPSVVRANYSKPLWRSRSVLKQPDAGASLDDKQCTGLALVTPMEQQHTVQR